ncbi:uncharacterized protein LOC119094399 [Pollicipes pollicipes]|uniref:uncharacterized protein LOC119094399 n=1 Tax=Pollicipes pollicipes TaxID=41117 RepID=UPI001885853C|nr:uncharacterized protein LOC119094399 [Pollicipes pollicipes]
MRQDREEPESYETQRAFMTSRIESAPAAERYFCTLSPLCKRIISNVQTIRTLHADGWDELSYADQCQVIDGHMVNQCETWAEVGLRGQDDCASVNCRMLCPYSFKLDERGCPLCQCWDPCQDVQCPGQLSCQLEEMPCANEPCPPVPTCKQPRSLETLCLAGRPLTFAEGNRPFLCGTDSGKPQCPPLHECNVPSGADYGVCCPSMEKALAPPARCPAPPLGEREVCGVPCQFDFQCSRYDACCRSHECGTHCVPTTNKTKCEQKRQLAELMMINEKQGRGYVPQCTEDGSFERRQCSRNGLVCWCVDPDGTNVRGTMGPADGVVCHPSDVNRISSGRSLGCATLRCAEVCQYGHQPDASGCPTCQCVRPCDEYPCPEGTVCVATPTPGCHGPLCQATPSCVAFEIQGTPDIPEQPQTDSQQTPNEGLTETHQSELMTTNMHQMKAATEQNQLPTEGATGSDATAEPVAASFPLEGGWTVDETPNGVALDGDWSAPTPVKVPLQGDWVEFEEGSGELEEPVARGAAPPADGVLQVVDSVVSVLMDHRAQTGDGEQTEVVRDYRQQGQGQENVGVAPEELDTPEDGGAQSQGSVESVPSEYVGDADVGDFVEYEVEQKLPAPAPEDYTIEARVSHQGQGLGGSRIQALDATEFQLLEHEPENAVDQRFPGRLDGGGGDLLPQRPSEKPGQCPYSGPVGGGSCDLQCADDADCTGEHKCCSSGCGTECVRPLLATACQHEKAVLEERARSSGVPLGRTYIPHCRNEDGHYSPVQCHPVLGVCWCVDEAGRERPGTRAAGRHNVNCSRPALSSCPRLDCPAYCPAGRRLDARGCPTCQCHHPCEGVRCSEGLECRPVPVRCVSGPCPPLPLCLPAVADPCPQGRPLPGARCGPGQEACPGSHQCHISPFHEYDVCCPKPRDVCQLPVAEGRCGESLVRWHFDRETGSCRTFTFSGCGGNQNNFDTLEECKAVCPVLTQCQQQREKSQLAAQLYKRVAFIPKCHPETGAWEPVQCQPEFGLCWCVHANGTQVRGSMVAGVPSCSARQGRRLSLLPQRTHICERGETVHACPRSLCENKVCLSDPSATCRIDPCGRCGYRFYDAGGNEVDCSRGLTACQRERQEVLNSAAWRQHGQYEARDRSSVRLYAALRGILSQSGAEPGRGSSLHGDLLADGLVVGPPVCDELGGYRAEQGSGGLMWCVAEDGAPLHRTITRGLIRCDRQGNVVERQALSPVCDSEVAPRVCRHECLRAACPGHTDAVCVADPCNNCHVTFFSVTGREVQCDRPCSQPVVSGQCRASIPRFFYDQQLGQCQPFLYGGCGGNDNNFGSLDDCQAQCEQPVDICSLPVSSGPCSDAHVRWFYNSVTEDCEPFTYGGCAGNGNNFRSRQACQARCPDLVLCPSVPGSLTACSRGQSCGNATCAARPSAVCRVEPCSCQPYFTDVNGERIDCQAEPEDTAQGHAKVVIVNAVPKTVTLKKVIKHIPTEPSSTTTTTTEMAEEDPTTVPVPAAAPETAGPQHTPVSAGPQYIPLPAGPTEQEAAISRNELTDDDGGDATSALEGMREVTFTLSSPAGEVSSPWGADFDATPASEVPSDVAEDGLTATVAVGFDLASG